MEDNEGGFDEWKAMISSPKFVSMEELNSKPNPIFQSPHVDEDKFVDPPLLNNNNEEEINGIVYDYYNNNNCPDEEEEEEESRGRKPPASAVVGGGGGSISIAERRAGRWGFNHTPKINTEWGGLEGCYSVAAPAPYITIPPGISPTALLLDSSVLLPNSQPLMDFEFPMDFPRAFSATKTEPSVNKVPKSRILNADCRLVSQSCHTDGAAGDQMHQHEEHTDHVEDAAQVHNLQEGDPREMQPLTGDLKTSEDGYNWRKYGQKLVRGYPRSYYRCTHLNCHVRKMLERSHEGHITEIIYKGSHDHPKPHSNWQLTKPSFLYNEMLEKVEANGSCVELGLKDIKVSSDWGAAGLETSIPVLTDSCHLLSNSKLKPRAVESPEISSTLASHTEDDDDESGSKQRKTKKALWGARKPKVVVKLESEMHKLDDGYRWRKYGQKVVRGNTNPRSYYKCTSAGCSVKKHVEKACHNKKSFIVTYEGNHNHEMLGTKNSGHPNLGGGAGGTLFPAAASSTGPTPTLPQNANATEPEEQVRKPAFCFERIPYLGNEFLESSLLGNFSSVMKFEASSMYQVNFPFSQISPPYGSFLPDFPHSLPLSIPLSASNMEPVDIDFNNHGIPAGSVGYFVGGQWLRDNDARLVKRKQEHNDDSL